MKRLITYKSNIDSSIKQLIDQFNRLKQSDEFFEIKNFLPREIRAGFLNFLKFSNNDEQRVYQSLQGVNVLIYYDLYTSGTTIAEMLRILNSVNPNNNLIAFILIKQ